MHNSTVTGKGFLNSTAALLTGIGTLLAALVALGVFLFGEGIFPSHGGGDGGGGLSKSDRGVQFQGIFGRDGTDGFELDGEKGIVRNPEGDDADIVVYAGLDSIAVYKGGIVEWTEEKPPTQQECAARLDSHGALTSFDIEMGRRFCVRSSGGRTAFIAVISDGKEFQVTVWKKA